MEPLFQTSVNSNSFKACLQVIEKLVERLVERFHLFKIELYARRIAEGQTNSFKKQRWQKNKTVSKKLNWIHFIILII